MLITAITNLITTHALAQLRAKEQRKNRDKAYRRELDKAERKLKK